VGSYACHGTAEVVGIDIRGEIGRSNPKAGCASVEGVGSSGCEAEEDAGEEELLGKEH
jgi:hypothetical protein